MCGIAGIVDFEGRSRRQQVEEMLKAVGHRGPDGWGVEASKGVTLGHVRLSILDLTDRAAQPMVRGGNTITYNGEIYNYIELRNELRSLGHRFVSDSDTEVVLAAYEEWGPACVHRFEGMWAFAIHDGSAMEVFCSRDRFGMKPFLYERSTRAFVFGSEPCQFRTQGRGFYPDMTSVYDFLVFGSSLRSERTFLADVRNLPPGHNLTVELTTGRIRVQRYYLVAESSEFSGLTAEEYGEVLRVEFVRSTRRHLRSDVRVGVLLSGGVDSSLVASVAAPLYREASGGDLMAFTATSGDSRNDEAGYARKVAAAAGIEWVPIPVSSSVTADRWREATRVIQQPLADSSHVMQLEVMRGARNHGCTVLLDGQGADESWMGYERYAVVASRDVPLRDFPAFARGSARNMGMSVPRWAAMWGYFSWSTLSATRARWRLRKLGLELDADWFDSAFRRVNLSGHGRTDVQQAELQGAQLGGLLRYADLTSMSLSLEDRLPFLDMRLVELAISIPTKLLFRDGWTKYPLRKFLELLAPAAIAWRRRKIGFEAPRTSFRLSDSEVMATMSQSLVLKDLGIDVSTLASIPTVMAWRLYAIALWESVSV